MTKTLSGLVLDEHGDCVEKVGGKKTKPSARIKKPQKMRAMERVKTQLQGYKYMGHTWKTACVPLDESDFVTFDNQQVHNKKHSDWQELDEFYKKPFGPRRTLTEKEKEFKKEAKFFHEHSDSRRHMLIFSTCREGDVKPVCHSCKLFRKYHPLAPGFWEELGVPKRGQGALFFVPEQDTDDPKHSKTLLRQVTLCSRYSLIKVFFL